ncbi:MAG: DMT family transporter [Gammaproteobacteria bacterium]|nr:DMT family transporter [Gammaproteobacteria bacterium]
MSVAPAPRATIQSAFRGCLYMLASTVFFASMHAFVRFISAEIHPFEVTFFRNLFGFVALTPWLVIHGLEPLRTRRFGLHFARAGTNVVAMLMFFMALSMSPMVQVQALAFTAPLFTTVLAALILKEDVRIRRWMATLVGFIGALIIIRPGFQPIDAGALLTVASAAVWAFTMIIIKQLSRTDSAFTITAYMVILMTPMSLVAAAPVWSWPNLEQLGWLAACGITGTVAQLLMAQAFRSADASVVLPLDFMKVVWGAIIAWLWFSEVVGIWTWIGALIIFIGASYIAFRERHLEKEKADA